MFHHLISLVLEGALHVVALPTQLNRILDLGTGTGIWAIDMADAHPSAHVIGVDLSPIQPGWVPPNCVFEVDDLEKPWLWKEPFDFIHSQNIAQGIRDWPLYMKRIYDNLTPGGVVQLLEARMFFESDDDSLPKGGAVEQYFDAFKKASVIAGIKDQADGMEANLRELGYEDVRTVVKKMPIGPWPKDPKKKEQGRWGMAIVEQGFKAYGSAMFTRLLGMSLEEADELCDNAFKECRQRGVHSYNAQYDPTPVLAVHVLTAFLGSLSRDVNPSP